VVNLRKKIKFSECLRRWVVVVVIVDLKAHQLLRLFAPVHCLNYNILVLRLNMIEFQLKVKNDS
jgi:hypothetical protein